MSDNISRCGECNAVFKRLYDLRRHVRTLHGGEGKLEQLAPLKNRTYNFSCDICNKNFNHKKHLTFHKKTHGVSVDSVAKNAKKCPLCIFTGSSKIQLNSHFKKIHNIELCFENLVFKTKDDFELWKNGIEQDSKSKFIKQCGDIVCKSHRKIYYACHRSGYYTSESHNKRHLKTQGSWKIGGFCPSGINVTVDKNGQCQVMYLKTHVGHTMELCHLTLSTEEKREIAAKIAKKIPFSDILDEVRDGVSKDSIQRIHLLTRKDLHNIAARFNLQSEAVRDPNDIESKNAEAENIYKCLSTNSSNDVRNGQSLQDKKEKVKKWFDSVLQSIESESQLQILAKLIAPIKSSLEAAVVKEKTIHKALKEKIQVPPNKKVDQPRRLYSTKKEDIKDTHNRRKK